MKSEDYLRLLESNQPLIEQLDESRWNRRSFGHDYFGNDICQDQFIDCIKRAGYPDWLFAMCKEDDYQKHCYIVRTVEVRGASGGNCYEDGEAKSWENYDRDDEKDDVDHAKFKSVFGYDLMDLPRYDFEGNITEYYGNYTDIEYHFVMLYDMVNHRKSKISRILESDE